LKREKQQLSNQIDSARDRGNTAARDFEISRRGVQQAILDGAHVICATLSGSGHEMFQGLNIEFETVIIDEAAQSIELSALIPLKYGCSKCILVGDPKQLPPTVLSREAARFSYEQSLFVRMQANHPNDVHLLDTQYRMHPEISRFPSSSFYDGRLLDGPDMAKSTARPWHQSQILGPYRFFDVHGTHQSAPRGHSLINLAEIDVALTLFDRLITEYRGYDFQGRIGIITPYKSQLRELRSRFAQKYGDAIFATVEFNTTDAFQGRESEVIIFSCVRASLKQGIGFLADIRRMNVGITRAKSSLWVLGNSQSLMQGEFWARLIQDAKMRDRYTDGDLSSKLKKPPTDLCLQSLGVGGSAQFGIPSVENNDIEMPDALSVDSSSATSRRSSTVTASISNGKLAESAESKLYRPSGGGNGLNNNGNCGFCGSFSHWTNQCDNEQAMKQSYGRCYRCGEIGHAKTRCTAERCLSCGEVGHTKKTCTSTKFLSNKEREIIGRQEIDHRAILQNDPEIKRKKQLGDHGRQVPVIRSTSNTPPPEPQGKKRRRVRSPPRAPLEAPKGPKLPSTVSRSGHPNGNRPQIHGNPAAPRPVNGKLSDYQDGQPAKPLAPVALAAPKANSNSSYNPPSQHPGPYTGCSLSNQRSVPNSIGEPRLPTRSADGANNIIKAGEGSRGQPNPRPPPHLPNTVRPPKRKKEADPFIRKPSTKR